MINLSIGFDMKNENDPAGMCVLYTDENKVSHIQNMILGSKAELVYQLLTTPSAEWNLRPGDINDSGFNYAIEFAKQQFINP